MRMQARGCALTILAFCLGTAPTPARAGEGGTPSHDEALFARYCAGCHGFDARGVAGADAGASAPDLTHLALRSLHRGEPLALTPLVEFVTSARRPGPQRICGERVFAHLPPGRFRGHAERWVVRSALQHVATRQSAEPASSPPPASATR